MCPRSNEALYYDAERMRRTSFVLELYEQTFPIWHTQLHRSIWRKRFILPCWASSLPDRFAKFEVVDARHLRYLPLRIDFRQTNIDFDVRVRDDVCCERAKSLLFQVCNGLPVRLCDGSEHSQFVRLEGEDVGLGL